MALDAAKSQEQAEELSNKLWAIANDLRGTMDSTEFRNYILGTIFYRYLSERTEMYMVDLLKEDNMSYDEAFSNEEFKPIVEKWSIERLGYIMIYRSKAPQPRISSGTRHQYVVYYN